MLNRMILQGRLTADPEVKDVGGFSMLEFTVAWSEKYKDTESKCFLRCKAWRTTADFIGKYFKKGQEIVIEGKMLTEQWEKDGQKQSRSICQIEKVAFCGSKTDSVQTATQSASDDFVSVPEGANEELPFN